MTLLYFITQIFNKERTLKFSNFKIQRIIFIIFSIWSTAVLSNDNTTPSKPDFSKLVIASSNNFPPINLLNSEGQLTGFARDLADAVARELDIEVKHIHSSKWPEVLRWLDEGEADLIHDTGYTQEREAYLEFSLPIIEMPESIFVRDQQFNIINFDALAGKKVACVNQHITHIYLKKFKDISCHIVNTPAEGLIALINGSVDAFIYPEQIVLYLAQQLELQRKIKVVGKPLRVLSWSMTVKKGNKQLLEYLNQGITTIKQNGEYQKIYDKWFGKNIFSGFSKNEVYIIAAISVLLSLLFTISISFWFYRRKMRSANRALQDSEHKYRTLVEKSPQSIFLKDTQSVYITCNQHFADSLGITPEEITGKTDDELFPKNAAAYREGDLKAMESAETVEFIEPYIEDNGKTGHIHTSKTPVYNDKGQLTGILGFFWDISKQYNLQKELSTTIKEYNAITATVPDVMYKLNMDGKFTWWNATFQEVTGVKPEQLEKLHASEVIADESHSQLKDAITQAFEKGYTDIELLLLTKSGKVPYFFNGARLLDDNGNVIGIVGSGRDMSKQKEIESKQEKLQTQLMQAQKMESIGQLTGGIAHDFNNMLASILGYSELTTQGLNKNYPVKKLLRYVNEITNSGERARDLIAQMLAFARVHKGVTKSIDIKNFIEELIRMMRPMIPTTINIQQQIEDHLPTIQIDPVMTQQMLINLCINARDAIVEHGTITITASRIHLDDELCDSCHHRFTGDYIQLSVSDTGSGIDPEKISHIFEPFMTTKDVGKGTGMGLAMTHGITHEHGGHIRVISQPGNTLFAIYLPESLSQSLDSNSEDSIKSDSTSTLVGPDNKRILLVDDESSILEMLEEILLIQGYEVVAEKNSMQAMEIFINDPDYFDLVITDQTMPSLSGKELAQQMLKLRPELPIILCTGYSEKVDKVLAEKMGIKEYLRKPVNIQSLLNLLQKLL